MQYCNHSVVQAATTMLTQFSSIYGTIPEPEHKVLYDGGVLLQFVRFNVQKVSLVQAG